MNHLFMIEASDFILYSRKCINVVDHIKFNLLLDLGTG